VNISVLVYNPVPTDR